MIDPVSVANLALSISTKATEALNALRERAQISKDIDLKQQIATLYDTVLELKEVLSRLIGENKELRRQLEEQKQPQQIPTIKRVGDTNFYYIGDAGPYCQPCYDKNKLLVVLSPAEHIYGGGIRRSCPVCNCHFYERKPPEPSANYDWEDPWT